MYVHLGRDYVLNDRDIIGIFNLETTTISPRGREFLNYAQKNGAVVSLSDELPQSYVLADSPVDTIYLSELSPAALKQRLIAFTNSNEKTKQNKREKGNGRGNHYQYQRRNCDGP